MDRATLPTLASPRRPSRRAGFTLNELLIVMGIIVLILAMALPAFNLISGNRSQESAENQASSYLAIARSEAIGLQEPRGVIFFEDTGTGRMTMAQVYYPPTQNRPFLDLFPGRDEGILPLGVGMQGVPNTVPGGTSTQVPAYPWPPFAIVMFDGDGRLMQDPVTLATGSRVTTRLSQPGPAKVTLPQNNILPNIGFVLFDKSAYDALPATGQATWLGENAMPYLVNRYNGSLHKGE